MATLAWAVVTDWSARAQGPSGEARPPEAAAYAAMRTFLLALLGAWPGAARPSDYDREHLAGALHAAWPDTATWLLRTTSHADADTALADDAAPAPLDEWMRLLFQVAFRDTDTDLDAARFRIINLDQAWRASTPCAVPPDTPAARTAEAAEAARCVRAGGSRSTTVAVTVPLLLLTAIVAAAGVAGVVACVQSLPRRA